MKLEKTLSVIFAVLPLIFWHKGYEGIKVLLFLMLGLLLLIYWLFNSNKGIEKALNKTDLYYWVFLGTLTVSSVLGVHPLDSFLGGSYRHQGVLFFLTLWLVGKSVSHFTNETKEFLKLLLTISVVAQSFVIIGQKMLLISGFDLLSINGRPLGTLGEPNAVGGFLAIGAVFPYLLKRKLDKKLYLAYLLAIFLAIIFTASRGGLIMFWIVTIPIVTELVNRSKKLNIGTIIISTALLIVGIVFALSQSRAASRFESREVFFNMALSAISERPLIGYGAESGEVVYNLQFEREEMPLVGVIVDRSHNLILDILLWSGLLGTSLFLIWLYKSTTPIINRRDFNQLSAIGGFLFFSMLHPLGVVHWLMFFILLYL